MQKICIVYSHHKLGDLIWQLPYIKSISDFHKNKVHLMLRDKTQAKDILKDLDHIQSIEYNNFRKGFYYWIDTIKLLSKMLNPSGKILIYTHYGTSNLKKVDINRFYFEHVYYFSMTSLLILFKKFELSRFLLFQKL